MADGGDDFGAFVRVGGPLSGGRHLFLVASNVSSITFSQRMRQMNRQPFPKENQIGLTSDATFISYRYAGGSLIASQ